jgi:hypothetical protein
MLGWDRYGLHPVRTVGLVLHSCASRARNIDTLYFLLGWYRYVFDKYHVGISYANLVFLHPVGFAGHVVHFGASGA